MIFYQSIEQNQKKWRKYIFFIQAPFHDEEIKWVFLCLELKLKIVTKGEIKIFKN